VVWRLVRRAAPQGATELPRRQHFIVLGGDHFSGLMHHEGPLEVRAPFGSLSLNPAEIDVIVLPSGGEHGRITMLTGTDTAGDVQLGSVRVSLDVLEGTGAEPLEIVPERLQMIFAQPGAAPDEDTLERYRQGRARSLIEDAVAIRTDGTPVPGTIIQETDSLFFRAREGRRYTLETRNIVNLDTYIRLLGADAQTSLVEDDDGAGNLASRIEWTCPEAGTYYLQVWRLGCGPGQVQPGYSYGYTAGTYEAAVTERAQ
jgi:hypothetical protein